MTSIRVVRAALSSEAFFMRISVLPRAKNVIAGHFGVGFTPYAFAERDGDGCGLETIANPARATLLGGSVCRVHYSVVGGGNPRL